MPFCFNFFLIALDALTNIYYTTDISASYRRPLEMALILSAKRFYDLLVKFFFFFLWQHLQHMEVPRLGAEWELQL